MISIENKSLRVGVQLPLFELFEITPLYIYIYIFNCEEVSWLLGRVQVKKSWFSIII